MRKCLDEAVVEDLAVRIFPQCLQPTSPPMHRTPFQAITCSSTKGVLSNIGDRRSNFGVGTRIGDRVITTCPERQPARRIGGVSAEQQSSLRFDALPLGQPASTVGHAFTTSTRDSSTPDRPQHAFLFTTALHPSTSIACAVVVRCSVSSTSDNAEPSSWPRPILPAITSFCDEDLLITNERRRRHHECRE